MKSNELRIGNYISSILHRGIYTQIHTVMLNGVKLWLNPLAISYGLDDIKCIPLTPEILDKVTLPDDYYLDRGDLYKMFGMGGAVWLCAVDSLHHLQNVMHSLTGQELNIEL